MWYVHIHVYYVHIHVYYVHIHVYYVHIDSNNSYKTISEDKLRDLCTLAYSDNVDLQRSAALCFSELSEKCKFHTHTHTHTTLQ